MTIHRHERLRWLGRLEEDVVSVLGTGPHGYHSVSPGNKAEFLLGLPEHVIWLLVGGACSVVADSRPINLGPGSALWIKPFVPFELSVSSNRDMMLYRFRLAAMPDVDIALDPVVTVSNAWDVRGVFDALIAELDTSLPMREHRLHGLLLVLFTSLFRLAERSNHYPPLDSARRRLVEEFVENHIAERPTIDELASLASLSQTRFARRFRETYGMPPRSWLVQRRIQHAALLLDTSSESVTQIANRLGYSDVYLFSRQFKSVIGASPRAYQMRGG